jgi:hypothetical protein
MILDQLAANKKPNLAIDIVLGPSTRSDTANRMQEIISQSLFVEGMEDYISVDSDSFHRSNQVKVRPMYSQDYLAMRQPETVREVWERRR